MKYCGNCARKAPCSLECVSPQYSHWKRKQPRKKKMDMKIHELKIWPEYFKAVKSGLKNFEIRENDRNFEVGDILVLREFRPCAICNGKGTYRDYTDLEKCECMSSKNPKGKYTGKALKRKITYILEGNNVFGVDEKFCVMSIKP